MNENSARRRGVSLWVDKWISNSNLRSLIWGRLSCGEDKLTVKYFIYAHGEWIFARLSFQVQGTIKNWITVIPGTQFVGYHDKRVWMGDPKGISALAVVHQNIKQKHDQYYESP